MGQSQSNPVCTTPACVHAAAQILKNLAPHWQQMDPCTEFDKSESDPGCSAKKKSPNRRRDPMDPSRPLD